MNPTTLERPPRKRFAPELVPLEPPPLQSGDHLNVAEFGRRYEAMPDIKKAELIGGVVFMGSPVSVFHSDAQLALLTWLKLYSARTPGTKAGDDLTVRLDARNEVQPDGFLGIKERNGGQLRFSKEGFQLGAPELVAEIAVTSSDKDLHGKFDVYRAHRVKEYLVWQVLDGQLHWFSRTGGRYVELSPRADGIIASRIFPGLWLDASALLRDDFPAVEERLRAGLRSPEHAEFNRKLAATA